MKIVLIGAGNVASHMSFSLKQKGADIIQVFSRTEKSAAYLAGKLNAGFTTNTALLEKHADIYIYAVSDNALVELIPQIHIPDAVHLHTSGSTPMDMFRGHAAHYGVLYPLQTFSKGRTVDFSDIPLFVEYNDEKSEKRIMDAARMLSAKIYAAGSENRRKLHLAAVFACNFVNHMYETGSELAEDAGFGFDVLMPLIRETADKINSLNPFDAQTGPAVRNDDITINKHIALLAGKRKLAELYKNISGDIYAVHNKTRC